MMDIFSLVSEVVEREERSHQTMESVNQKLARAAQLRQMADMLEVAAAIELQGIVDYDELGATKRVA
jgi:hypothetical protein